MTDDLATWLRAQLDADELTAQRAAANHPTWTYDRETFTVSSGGWSIAARKDDGSPINDVDGEHIARHDPARVLAEVDAKRRILDAFAAEDEYQGHRPAFDPGEWAALAEVVKLLAEPYAYRPGYREEWKP